jgi:hypothetical protein
LTRAPLTVPVLVGGWRVSSYLFLNKALASILAEQLWVEPYKEKENKKT